jgi:hypothetical protein
MRSSAGVIFALPKAKHFCFDGKNQIFALPKAKHFCFDGIFALPKN